MSRKCAFMIKEQHWNWYRGNKEQGNENISLWPGNIKPNNKSCLQVTKINEIFGNQIRKPGWRCCVSSCIAWNHFIDLWVESVENGKIYRSRRQLSITLPFSHKILSITIIHCKEKDEYSEYVFNLLWNKTNAILRSLLWIQIVWDALVHPQNFPKAR